MDKLIALKTDLKAFLEERSVTGLEITVNSDGQLEGKLESPKYTSVDGALLADDAKALEVWFRDNYLPYSSKQVISLIIHSIGPTLLIRVETVDGDFVI